MRKNSLASVTQQQLAWPSFLSQPVKQHDLSLSNLAIVDIFPDKQQNVMGKLGGVMCHPLEHSSHRTLFTVTSPLSYQFVGLSHLLGEARDLSLLAIHRISNSL